MGSQAGPQNSQSPQMGQMQQMQHMLGGMQGGAPPPQPGVSPGQNPASPFAAGGQFNPGPQQMDQAIPAPVIRLSQGLRLQANIVIRANIPAHWGPQVPLDAAPPLARELDARVAVAGRTWGLSGQLWIIGSI